MKKNGGELKEAPRWDLATTIIDRRLQEQVDWLQGQDLNHFRQWLSHSAERQWFRLGDAAPAGGNRFSPRVRGSAEGHPTGPEALSLRKVLAFIEAQHRVPTIVVLARDDDRKPERSGTYRALAAANQDPDQLHWSFRLVLMLPAPECEAWLVAAFEPSTKTEREMLPSLTKELRFDPTQQPHRMTSTKNQAPTDAKAVLARPTQKDSERVNQCLTNPPADWRNRCKASGLPEFLDGVDQHIVRAVAGGRP